MGGKSFWTYITYICALALVSPLAANPPAPEPPSGAGGGTIPLGNLGGGVLVNDNAQGQGYMLFVPGGRDDRFPAHSGQATKFVAVQFINSVWHFDSNVRMYPFVPQATDLIVASIDFTADTVTMLNGQDTVIHGLRAGYINGDLSITANMWHGSYNYGEFGVSGTYITPNPMPVVPPAAKIPLSQKPWTIDNGSGIAYAEGENDEGTAYSFRFLSQQGVNYRIEESENLADWTPVGFYHGLGLTINHPLFPLIKNEGGEAVVEATPEEYTPPINASLRIAEVKSGSATTGLHLSWLSMDDGTPMNYTLHGSTLETGFPTLYSKQFDNYVFFIQFVIGGMDASDVPTPDTLRPNDAAMIGKLLDSLPTINAEIAANTAAQAANPSPPPASGSKKFYRIKRIHADSDGDGILDHIEVANGTDHYSWDSDGDGQSDSEDSNPTENAAMADPDGAGLTGTALNGLTGRWDFEQLNGQGHYPDKTANSNDAQLVGSEQQKLGIISRAFELIPNTTSQAGNHLTMAAPSMGSVYSLSMWIKPKKYDLQGLNNQVLWSYQSTDGNTNLRLVLTTGKTLILRKKIQGQSVVKVASWTLPEAVNLGKWHHISLLRRVYSVPSISGYLHDLYFDGKKIPIAQSDAPVEQNTHSSGGAMAMGKDITSAPSAGATGEGEYDGLVDRLLLHNRALTSAEVLGIFRADSDRDGLWDVSESRSYMWRDTNGDGQQDSGEISYMINPFRWDRPDLDHDGDGLVSLDEQNHATQPTDIANPDSDQDLLPDGWELNNGLNPNDENDALLDGDNDGANNLVEYSFNSNPNASDTDGDGTNDGDEAGGPDGNPDTPGGSNPNDPSDNGQPLPPEEKLAIKIGVGDKSGSKSEDYVMNIFRLNPETGSEERFYTLRSGGHGQYKEITLDTFKKKDSYTFQIDWQSSSLSTSSSGSEGPDYDYVFEVEPQDDENGILVDQYDPGVKRADTSKPILGNVNDKEDFPQSVEPKRVVRVTAKMIPDFNRDGKIDQEDWEKVDDNNPWRWWINDDNDLTAAERGNNDQDIPKQDASVRDCNDLAVDGMRDLIDFFPLHLDLKQALKVMPESQYKYVLKHEGGALKFFEYPACVINGSDSKNAPDSHVKTVSLGRIMATRELKQASSQGQELSKALLEKAKEGKGVVLMEGSVKTDKPLVLEIISKTDNASVGEIEFPLNIVDVEDMYRHVNVRGVADGNGGNATQTDEPSGYPDSLTNGKYVAYTHGYNVSADSARGSQSNIFKRLHHLGNKGRYIGISWHGNPRNPGANILLPPDYHRAVYNGLLTGMNLKFYLDFTQESDLIVLAHSLGNSVISNAIANHGLEVDQYYIINGAIPLQAYDAAQKSNSSDHDDMTLYMTEDDWKPYHEANQQRLFAANWHELFKDTPSDNRNKLTWKNIFAKSELLNVAYNFYSPTDEVVENPNISEEFADLDNLKDAIVGGGRHAWVGQEIAKGGQNVFAFEAFHDLNGGWQFNTSWDIFEPTGNAGYHRRRTPAEAAQITNEQLKTQPFHKLFLYADLHDPAKGSTVAGVAGDRYKLLGTGIPATSYAIATNAADPFSEDRIGEERNFNMETELKSPDGVTTWPVHPKAEDPGDWMHSDFKDVALQFVHPMYQRMIDLGELDKK